MSLAVATTALAAVSTGKPSPLTGPLTQQLRPAAETTVEPLRGFAYALPLPAVPTDDEEAALLGYLGRDASWIASRRTRAVEEAGVQDC